MIEVRPGGRRRIDRVLAPDYTEGVEQRPLVEVRELRDEAAQEETDLSYLRRLLHARIDIVRAEQQRRSSGGSAVVDQLATILSSNAVGPATGLGRYQTHEPSRADAHQRHVEALISDVDLSDVSKLSDDRLGEVLETFISEEASVSVRRREVQVVVDRLNAEIASRYQRGSASVDELLAAERGHHRPKR
ncbi:aerial mycelium formation protein [Lentzea guizhouensis]|uniref:Aerial mycelium formation protein n=1 Tax=Lentzea guizhouensis TaxID=1586287 RepID=A0A1B2HI27_9PSEU|nr:aerial mycelium formation protein [Lentzea guizhouensis]ANZ37361.1 aerial mycelium formation protein [Lentzea guizhouensis]